MAIGESAGLLEVGQLASIVDMNRILVIGPSGSGKSTLSTTLGKKLGIEVLHLDRFYWSCGWIKPLPDAWTQTVSKLLTGDRWIIDGNYSGTLEQRIEACDTIVFLDMRMATCLWRVFKRRLLYRSQRGKYDKHNSNRTR